MRAFGTEIALLSTAISTTIYGQQGALFHLVYYLLGIIS